ncbi:MAG TPA: exonuclease SbcCD subunit D [Eubacteriaceae bacterium]|jgi:exonuclease SbcD|nr:exonuclease SbcCD subunit D [Eubacteriaceae bacterium]
MRILHTSDWHLGKSLEGYSRLPEQEKFLEELEAIVDRENIDLILVAGDIYDHYNPPAVAEQLFYKSMKRLSKDGQRPIVVIAGNHDNPDRLMAASPLAYEQGIILLGYPRSVVPTGKYGGFQVVQSGPGYLELAIGKERAVIITLPYPSEKRINEIISIQEDEAEAQQSYSQRIGEIFKELSKYYREDTINLALSHLYMIGGEESDSERQIQLGGTMAVGAEQLPNAQYIALGHLHRPQKVIGSFNKAYYSGSPLQYSKSEINYGKCVYRVDVNTGEPPDVKPIYLKNYKPIEIWKCEGIEEALKMCQDHAKEDIWVYLEIKTDRVLTRDEIKALRDIRKDIVEIRPLLIEEEALEENRIDNISQLNMVDLFKKFYLKEREVQPSQELIEMFIKIIGEGEKEIETTGTED